MFTKKSAICLENAKRQSTLENSLFIQKVHEENRHDKCIEDVFVRSTKENPYLKKLQSTTVICEALRDEKLNDFIHGRRELVRRGNCLELKQLETQLRAAYVSKTIAAQKAERDALAIEAKAKVVHENTELERSRLRLFEHIKMHDAIKRRTKLALQQALKDQMATLDAKRQEEKLNIINEKKLLDEDVRKFKEQDLREAREALDKKHKIRRGMDEFQKIQDEWKLKQNQATEEENKKLEEFLKHRENIKQGVLKRKIEEQERKNRISDEIGKRTHAQSVEKIKSFERLTELLIDERKAKEEMKIIADHENHIRQRIVVRSDLDELIEQKKRQRLDEKRENEELYQHELRVLAERDRIQREKDEQKRIRVEQHRHALQNALDEKKRLRAEEMKRLLLENHNEVEDQKRKAKLVEEARVTLLKEHISNLKGFLPPRLLKRSDLEYLSL